MTNCEHVWHLLVQMNFHSTGGVQIGTCFLTRYFPLLLVAFCLESVFWYACCQIWLNTPLGIRNVFIKRTGFLAASELSILFLCCCWASLPFQVSETIEKCCKKTCPMWWFVFVEVLLLRSKEHSVVSFLSLIVRGCPYFLRTAGTPLNCSFKWSPPDSWCPNSLYKMKVLLLLW